jgi:hypothetical protein
MFEPREHIRQWHLVIYKTCQHFSAAVWLLGSENVYERGRIAQRVGGKKAARPRSEAASVLFTTTSNTRLHLGRMLLRTFRSSTL